MSFLAELKRRNVFRVGIAYVLLGWVVLQGADFALDLIDAPNWIIQALFIIGLVGLPFALFFAWAFELTPEGIKREEDVDRSQSVTPQTGRKLDRAIIAFLVVAVLLLLGDRWLQPEPAPGQRSAAVPPVASAPGFDANAIAVLPFANRSNREEDLFFTDGIHDDLLTQLAKIDGLKVISRTSMMAYRDSSKQIPQIASELGVGIILEGGVQRAGNRVRINAQLIEVTSDQHLWAETFDREMTIDNIFDIQSEISRRIVSAVKGEVSPQDSQALSNRPTDSLAAWEDYLRAQKILRETDYEISKYDRAEPLVRRALEADPEFADAWVMLVGVQLQRDIWMGVNDTRSLREEVRDNIERAIALAPNSPQVLAVQADYEYRINLDYEASLALIDQALALAPGMVDYHHHRGLALRRMGRFEEAVAAFEHALDLDPLDVYTAATLAETFSIMNDWERLEPFVDRWLRLDPDSADLVTWKTRMLIDRYGDLEQAQSLLDRFQVDAGNRLSAAFTETAAFRRDWDRLIEIEADPDNTGFMAVLDWTPDFRLGQAYAMKGDMETAASYLRRYLEHAQSDTEESRIARSAQAMNVAKAHSWLGNREQAVESIRLAAELMPTDLDMLWGLPIEAEEIRIMAWAGQRDAALERLAERIDGPGYLSRWRLYLDPAWDFFRDDPRFNDLVRPEGVEPEPFRNQRLGDGT